MKLNHALRWSAAPTETFRDKKVVIVGGTGGIGRAFALALAAVGATVTVIGRTFRDQSVAGLRFLPADLSLMREARRIGETLEADDLDLVIFTTGIMAGPTREETSEGLERDLAISYLSRFVILRALAPRLGRSVGMGKPRVFIMGFPGSGQTANVADLNSHQSYGRMAAHMNTVAGNEALVLDSARRYPQFNTFGLNPGFVKTDIRGNLFGGKTWLYHLIETVSGFVAKTPEAYVRTMLPLLLAAELDGYSGAMFDSKARAIMPSATLDADATAAVIAASEALLSNRSS